MRDPTMAAATLVGAQADAMKTAAGNEAGAMTGFMGMGMAMNAAGGGMTESFRYGTATAGSAVGSDTTADTGTAGSRRMEMCMWYYSNR